MAQHWQLVVGLAFPLQVAMMSSSHLHSITLPAHQVLLAYWALCCFISAIVWMALSCNSSMPPFLAAGLDTNGRSIFNVPQAAGAFGVFANGNGHDIEQEEVDKGPTNFQPEVR